MQVHICRNGGEDVSIDDCALLSEPMEQAIENSKLLIEDYVLEISSPGIQDLLTTERDFITFKGFPVEVTFRNQKQPEAHLTGLLKGRTSEDIQLNIKGRSCRIPIEDLISVRLVSPSG